MNIVGITCTSPVTVEPVEAYWKFCRGDLQRDTTQLHDSFAKYRRTYRVFDENGRLMIEALGGVPERLFKQEDGSFAMRTSPRGKVTFVIKDGRAASLTMDGSGLGAPLSGA